MTIGIVRTDGQGGGQYREQPPDYLSGWMLDVWYQVRGLVPPGGWLTDYAQRVGSAQGGGQSAPSFDLQAWLKSLFSGAEATGSSLVSLSDSARIAVYGGLALGLLYVVTRR